MCLCLSAVMAMTANAQTLTTNSAARLAVPPQWHCGISTKQAPLSACLSAAEKAMTGQCACGLLRHLDLFGRAWGESDCMPVSFQDVQAAAGFSRMFVAFVFAKVKSSKNLMGKNQTAVRVCERISSKDRIY
jgi:hypothetical protein